MNSRRVSILMAGVVSGLLSSFFAITHTSLIFTSEVSIFAPTVVGYFLQGALIIGLTSALFNSIRGAISTVQDVPAAMYAILAATMVSRMASSTSPEAIFATLVAGLSLAALASGLWFCLLGLARLGGLVWYTPFPGTAALMANVELYLILGAIKIATGISISYANAPLLLTPGALRCWLPATALGLACFFLNRRYRHPGVLPAFLLAVIVGFQI